MTVLTSQVLLPLMGNKSTSVVSSRQLSGGKTPLFHTKLPARSCPQEGGKGRKIDEWEILARALIIGRYVKLNEMFGFRPCSAQLCDGWLNGADQHVGVIRGETLMYLRLGSKL